ncbi:MAG: hypothetical protein IJ279_01475 [Clostridia bacterium]|nr:hypothetical protein [Clostridia bacterium]
MNISDLTGRMLFVMDFSAIVNIKSQGVWERLTEQIIANKMQVFVSKEFYENYEVIIKSLNEDQKKIAKMAYSFLEKLKKNQLLVTKSDILDNTEIIEMLYLNPNVCFVYYCDSEFAENVLRKAKKPRCKAIVVDSNGDAIVCDSDEIFGATRRSIDASVIGDGYFKTGFEAKEGKQVKTSDGQVVTLKSFIASGGEGAVYECDYRENYVVKIYNDGQLNKLRMRKLVQMEKKQVKYDGVCWPEKVVLSPEGMIIGFLMKKVSGKNLSEVFDGSENLLREFPGWKKYDLVDFTIKLLQKIQYLHLLGIIVGDLRFKNIIIDSKGDPCLVDLDSCQIRGLPCPSGFPDFTDPDLHGIELMRILRSYSNEDYSCAVVVFKILFCGIHPYDQRNGAETIEEEMRDKRFPYPRNSVGSFERIPLLGGYSSMWKNTPDQMQEFFYDIFKNGTRYSVLELILMLKTYKKFLEKEKHRIPSINEILFD